MHVSEWKKMGCYKRQYFKMSMILIWIVLNNVKFPEFDHCSAAMYQNVLIIKKCMHKNSRKQCLISANYLLIFSEKNNKVNVQSIGEI